MLSKNCYLFDEADPNPNSLDSHHEIPITHHDLLSAHYLPPPPSSAPKTSKKDRHSKIHTAQGPRDRRVRLSIGVARKFFDLQELLGFDKPSKTLDWLLTKSRSAIKHVTSKSTNSSECDDDDDNNNNNNNNNSINSPQEKSTADKKGKSRKKNNYNNKGGDVIKQAAKNLAKESRVKARARARERTREKMCIKQQLEIQGTASTYHDLPHMHSYINSQLEACRAYELDNDLIREDAVKRKVNRQPLTFGLHHPDYSVQASSYNNIGDGWDMGNFASQSGLTAILEHHKFNISSSND